MEGGFRPNKVNIIMKKTKLLTNRTAAFSKNDNSGFERLKLYFNAFFRKTKSFMHGVVIISFLCSFTLSSFFVIMNLKSRESVKLSNMEQLVLDRSLRINDVVSQLLHRTYWLSAGVRYGGDIYTEFDKIAPLIVDNPAVFSTLIAPNGVVSKVYPLKGNEDLIGFDFFKNNFGGIKALSGDKTGNLVMGGPFTSIPGVEIIAGRLPIFMDTPNEKQKFWGLVSVTLRLDEILNSIALDIIEHNGFSYELWRVNPDTGKKYVIAGSKARRISPNAVSIEKNISVINADWRLKIWSNKSWYDYPENVVLVLASFLMCFIVMYATHENAELKRMKAILEDIARTDPLTGAYNRRHFMEVARLSNERSRRFNEYDCVIIFDLDKFKSINDTYGHAMGDKVLTDTASRIKTLIRQYDLFARYGGEEFIIYAPQADKKGVCEMTERLRTAIFEQPFSLDGTSISVSASFGIAHVANYDLDAAIKNADKALYEAKNSGRNRVVFGG